MFSLDNFYYILYENLLKPANLYALHFYPFGSTSSENIQQDFHYPPKANDTILHHCLFYDQEPLIDEHFRKLNFSQRPHLFFTNKWGKILANSEHSLLKRQICKENNYIDWYYFFHGFAALDWYRDFQYFPKVEIPITKLFMNLNHLTTKDRSYRLLFVSHLIDKNLLGNGHVSLHIKNNWQDELDLDIKLPKKDIPFIREQISKVPHGLVLDSPKIDGTASARFDHTTIKFSKEALWHIVSETIFYYDKLHLTEKIFKPIVHKRPFMLLGAPGNLEYLKTYGFKTFDRWIDESYDKEKDNSRRIEMVIGELEKLNRLSPNELNLMYLEMSEILEHNFNHMYSDFKQILVDELVDNFEGCLRQWNNGRVDDRNIKFDHIDFNKVKKLLCQ